MKLILSSKGKTFETDFVTSDFSREEVYYNNLKQADNNATVTIPYDGDVQNFINAYADENIKAQIIDGSVHVFTGYVRKNFSFSKKQANQPMKLELVSPSFLLDTTVDQDFVLTGTSLGIAVGSLLSFADFTTTVELNNEIGLFQIEEGANVKDTLTELLFEYGYCYDFDSDGNFVIYPLFNNPKTLEVTQNFDGTNCRNEIKVNKKEQSNDSSKVCWDTIKYIEHGLIFADTTNGDADKYSCSIELPAKSYLGDIEDTTSYYITYDCAEGEVRYCKHGELVLESSNSSGLLYSYTNHGRKGELSVYNNTNKPITITKIVVYGNVYVTSCNNETSTTIGKKVKELEAPYIHSKTDAENLAKNYDNWLKYADYTVSLKSYTDYALGTFVKISDHGLGTVYGRIIKKKYYLDLKPIDYTIEAISEYEPTTVVSKSTKKSALIANGLVGAKGEKGDKGENGKDGKDGAKGDKGDRGEQGIKGDKGDTGAKGDKGDSGIGITSVTEYYLASASASGVTTSTSGWTTSIQTITTSKKYLWNYEKVTYSDSSTSSTSPIIIGAYGNTGATGAKGATGATGATGVGIKSISEHYLASASNSGITTSTSGWTTTIQTLTASKKYLWNYETITYTDNSISNSSPVIIGVYGDKGDTGAKGATGATGAKGDKGDKGDTGATGAKGDKGDKGDTGAKGATGAKGVSMRNRGTWASGTAYVNDASYIDVVYYATNGCSYSCIKSHTASSSILPTNTTYWSVLAKKGDNYWISKTWVDLSATTYNSNTWYPVVGTSISNDGVQSLRCTVQLNSGTVPSWSTHSNGFSCELEVQDQRSGWGTTPATCIRFIDNFAWTKAVDNVANVSPVSYTQMTNSSLPVFYLRGGGKYLLETTYSCSWSIKTASYTSNSQTVSPSANTRPAPRGTYVVGQNGSQGVRGAQYRGAYSSAPTSSLVSGDWYLNTGDGYCYYYTGSSWTKITSYSDYRYLQAMDDMVNLSATLKSNSSLTTSVNNWVKNLCAGTVLADTIATKTINLKTSGIIKSNNYVAGKTGFKIDYNGNAEFNNGTFNNITSDKGTFTHATIEENCIIKGQIQQGASFFVGTKIIISNGGSKINCSNSLYTNVYFYSTGILVVEIPPEHRKYGVPRVIRHYASDVKVSSAGEPTLGNLGNYSPGSTNPRYQLQASSGLNVFRFMPDGTAREFMPIYFTDNNNDSYITPSYAILTLFYV